MKESSKKYFIYGLATLVLMGASGGLGYHFGAKSEQEKAAEYGVQYAHDHGGEHEHEHDHDHEHSEAEQIVVKITDEGYVTSHGDHFHYFTGKVPHDAIFSEELLMNDPNYTLKDEDIQYEVDGGYIIKVEGKYYLYLNDPKNAKNIRTAEEIKEQQKIKGLHDHEHEHEGHGGAMGGSGSRDSAGRYTTDDGYVFSPSDVIQDLGDGYIVPHGDHFHFIPKADLTAAEIAAANRILAGGSKAQAGGRKHLAAGTGGTHWLPSRPQTQNGGPYTTDDGYVFKASDIIKDTGSGYIVPHGSHFHYIPKADLSPAEQEAARRFLSGQSGPGKSHQPQVSPAKKPAGKKPSTPSTTGQKPHASDSAQERDYEKMSLTELLDLLYKQPMHNRHRESDGLVFDPVQVIEKNDFGYIIPHGDHWHIIPPSQLSKLERVAADKYLAQKAGHSEPPRPETNPDKKPKPNVKPTPGVSPNPGVKPSPTDKPKPGSETNPDVKPTPRKEAFDIAAAKAFPKTYQGKDGKTYTTDDGYTFTVESVIQILEKGIVATHGDHTHYIPFGDLDDSEIDALATYLSDKQLKQDKKSSFSEEEIERRMKLVAIDQNMPVDQLQRDGDIVIIPHGNHFHTKDLKDVSVEKEMAEFLDQNKQVKPGREQDYEAYILDKKLDLIAYRYGVDRHNPNELLRSGNLVEVTKNGQRQTIDLNEVKLDFEHPEVHFEEQSQKPAPDKENSKTGAEKEENPESTDEKKDGETPSESSNPEENSKTAWTTLSLDEKRQVIADHYRVPLERVTEFDGILLISSESEDEENIIIDEAKFLEIYQAE